MMKKLFLLSAVCALGTTAVSAQFLVDKSSTNLMKQGNVNQNVQKFNMSPSAPISTPGTDTDPVGKATVGGSRWYSYAEYISKITVEDISDSTSVPYLWNKGDALAIYSTAAGGTIADSIDLGSYGMTFDPAFKSMPTSSLFTGFNEPLVYDKNDIVVTRAKAYTIDSVNIFAVYGRNNLKTASTDTIRLAVVYGNGASGGDLPAYPFTGSSYKANYGYDTVNSLLMRYDQRAGIISGGTRVVKDIYLKNTDTTSMIKAFGFPVGLNVPAGNVVGISVTFISGEIYTPYKDTVFIGQDRPGNPYNFGMIRPRFFAEPVTSGTLSAPSFPNYYPKYYNVGFIKPFPVTGGWDDYYLASYAFTGPFKLEIPDIDVKVSCPTCSTIGELGMGIGEQTVFSEVSAFPNPAALELNVPFALKEKANVTVSISNLLGQVIATQNMGNVNVGQKVMATFNTGALPAGIYLYTLEANGQRLANRFSVAR